jgi:hypothetical protein
VIIQAMMMNIMIKGDLHGKSSKDHF